jgi:hypothetical protein
MSAAADTTIAQIFVRFHCGSRPPNHAYASTEETTLRIADDSLSESCPAQL